MLLLKRRVGQAVHIGDHVVVTGKGVEGDRVTLDVVAPRDVAVLRSELLRRPKPDTNPREP